VEKPGKISQALSRMGVVGTGLVFLAGKTKYLFMGLKLTKFSTLASMFVTVGTYSLFFGLPYAGGMVGLIFVHELGHALAMRHYKSKSRTCCCLYMGTHHAKPYYLKL
jgi:hypothetical protein